MQSPREPGADVAGASRVSLGGWDTNAHSDPARPNQTVQPACGGQTHALAREVFTTSRLAEFCTRRELEKQTGHSTDDWPVYTVRELLDNALDAAEEGGVAPKVEIEIGTDRITVADNGPGIAAQIVERLLDLSSRTSGRSRYVSPTRGAQGQALSTILVMPYTLAPRSRAGVTIEAHGATHRIAVHVHPLTEEPRLAHEVTAGSVKIGTRISVDCPSTILTEATSDFLPLAQAYVLANPHLSLTLCTPEGKWTTEATNPVWTKWRACDPTSPHWYTPETFNRLVRAYIQKDQETGRRRLLRDFLEEFDNLSSTTRRSRVLATTALSGARLDNLVRDDQPAQETIVALLQAMQAETKPVKPARLGIIGETHIRHLIEALGNVKAFKWAKSSGADENGFPYVVEGAFAWNPGSTGRRLIVGANFASSPGLLLKFNPWESAGTVLEQRHAGAREPLVVFLHVTHPRLTFTDLGKTQVTLPRAVADDLQKLIERITAGWHRQRQQEEKDRRAEIKRQDALERARKVTIKESVYRHLPEAYKKASGDIGARSRQIFYQLRPLVLEDTGRGTLDSPYIEQQLIPDFIAENPELCAGWSVFYDDRGHAIEPHTGKVIGLGTRNVRDYHRSWWKPIISGFELSPPTVSTCGPIGRYGAILFCEKEGFTELFQAARLPERFDLMLASTKGTSVTAARELFELSALLSIPIFCLHDFDYNGFEIAATLHQDTRRYQFKHRPKVIAIGLRLADVQRLSLESEPVAYEKSANALRNNLQKYGATEAEISFLIDRKRRVELNAMSTPQLLEMVESALSRHGVRKVVPDANTLAETYRKQIKYREVSEAIEEAIRKAEDELGEIPTPDDLPERVAAYLKDNPTEPWEAGVEAVAGER